MDAIAFKDYTTNMKIFNSSYEENLPAGFPRSLTQRRRDAENGALFPDCAYPLCFL